MEDDINTTEAAAIGAMALAQAQPIDINGTPLVMIPAGYTLSNLAELADEPRRRKGHVSFNDAVSFVAYVASMKTASTRMYSTAEPPSFTAVFNDATATDAGWGDDLATYACPVSTEWKAWVSSSGKQMSQEDFANFIHRNNLDCIDPAPAAMLEISRDLTAKKKVNFASSIRLADGSNQFTYSEEVQGATTKGQIAIPEEFVIGVPVLEGGDPYRVTCDFRFRITDGGALFMWYELVRPHKIVEDAFGTVKANIQDGTGLHVFNGTRRR